jgi:hypothetical protein
MKKILFFILLAGTLSQACKRKDPCIVQKPTSADFRAYTIFEYPEHKEKKIVKIKVEDDTFILGYNPVTFEAIDSTAEEYNWKVGLSDEVYTQRKFSLIFKEPDVRPGELINIQLIVKKKPNKDCFPNDDGVDTVTKTIRFINFDQTAWKGKYYGSDNTDPNNFYTIEIKDQYFSQIDAKHTLIFGLGQPTKCTTNPIIFYDGGTKYMIIANLNDTRIMPSVYPDCFPFTLWIYEKNLARLSDDKQEITIDYVPRVGSNSNEVYDTPASKFERTFKGKRVQ